MFLKDLLFPKLCLSCGYLGAYICCSCQKKLNKIKKDSCLYCEKASINGYSHPNCLKKNGVAGFVGVFNYDNRLKKIIKEIKYRRVKEALTELIALIDFGSIKKLKNFLSGFFLIQPIPLHLSKEKERGFNQAGLIANYLAKDLNVSLVQGLIRKRPTKTQAQLSKKKDRLKNINGAFCATNKRTIKGKNILLVDDVLTTGSTIKEAARTLKKAGANKIYAFTLAKG